MKIKRIAHIGVAVAAILIIGVAIWYSRKGESFGREYEMTETRTEAASGGLVLPGGAAALDDLMNLNIEHEINSLPIGEEVKR